MYLSSLVLFSTEQVSANEVIKRQILMDWFTFGANFGEMRALSKTPQNDAITVLLEGNGVLNEILNKSVISLTVIVWPERSKNILDYNF